MGRSDFYLLVGAAFFILTLLFVQGGFDPSSESVNYTTIEDSVYSHNLSANITGFNDDINFTIDSDTDVQWTNSTGTYSVDKSAVQDWINIYNVDTGNLTINATKDNQTGYFVIVIQTFNTTSNSADDLGTFHFVVNATNDFPNITNINATYNFTALVPLYEFLNATDEEGHYPLIFNVTFNSTNCTHAAWSGYNNNENCSLYSLGFNLTSQNNLSAKINMTPTNNHAGVYYANISVIDAGANYNSSGYPYQEAGYSSNKTTYYSSIVTFNIFASLEINATDCQNKVFQENQSGDCNITIRTKGDADSLNISTYAILRNYGAGQSGVSNTSWFYDTGLTTSSDFQKNITINVTPQKTEIGNWTINFTVDDLTHNEESTTQIYVHVNRTLNDVPELGTINNVTTSISLSTVINLSVYDDDLLVPDKNYSYGGFNETINFSRTILNQSNLAQELTLSNFSITVLEMPVSGTNRTTAEIRFTPNATDSGNYTINISIIDNESALDYGLFNLSIISNNAPEWDAGVNTTVLIIEDNNAYLNLSMNVTDSDGNTLTFTYINDTPFLSFNLTSEGIMNFTSIDEDVGQHIVNITVSDGYLTDTESFNFTIYNINDSLDIISIQITNATPSSITTSGSSVNATEDNYTSFVLFVDDNDFKIPSGQKSFYNESLTIGVSIEGPNTTLFNFTRDASWPTTAAPNRSKYEAIFTPDKGDVGDYNITINVSDLSGNYEVFTFNLSVLETQHDPILSSLTNQSTAVNRTFYYDINVTDTEDGNDTSESVNTNFTFSYSFLSGTDFINSNETLFNTTTGILNITFNSTQGGKYRINITANDSSSKRDYEEDFWVLVYDSPNVSYPASGVVINLTENSTSVLNFTVNHSVGDNLTYNFSIDSINYNGSFNYGGLVLRNSVAYYGNGASYNWSFTPNLTDETYGLLKNLTLIVYPNSSGLTDAYKLNTTITFKLNISYANSPVEFVDNIDDQTTTYGSSVTISLYDHFSDDDHDDLYHAQNLTFTPSINTSSITYSVSSAGVLTLSALSTVTGLVNITANDSSTNNISNNFIVSFTEPTSTATNTGGPSSSIEIPVSLKIIMPDPVSAYKKDRIELPITLENDGSSTLYGITLKGSVARNGSLVEDINLSFSKDSFSSLAKGEKENLTMYIDINTQQAGTTEITVEAKVTSPSYTDWGKMFLTIQEGESVEEKIVFTEEFIVENPECVELTEMMEEAKTYFRQGNEEEAILLSEKALQACRDAISQAGKSRLEEVVENKLYRYLIVSTIAAFLIGIGFYSYKRIKLKRRRGSFLQEDIKNKKYLEFHHI